jgi:hypothetical protein
MTKALWRWSLKLRVRNQRPPKDLVYRLAGWIRISSVLQDQLARSEVGTDGTVDFFVCAAQTLVVRGVAHLRSYMFDLVQLETRDDQNALPGCRIFLKAWDGLNQASK